MKTAPPAKSAGGAERGNIRLKYHFAQGGLDQLRGQNAGLVALVQDGIDLYHVQGDQLLRAGDGLYRQEGLAGGETAVHHAASSRRGLPNTRINMEKKRICAWIKVFMSPLRSEAPAEGSKRSSSRITDGDTAGRDAATRGGMRMRNAAR